jgi:exopolysaccharide biosynthesis protein
MLDGRELTDWTDERFVKGFDTTRHPRTLIGVDGDGAIWLVTVDGRNPLLSLGMSFTELQRLARRLGLRSALNLDGGGSTTMWVDGQVVNRPTDAQGLRPVSEAIVVRPRID